MNLARYGWTLLVLGFLVGCPGEKLPRPETLAECKTLADTERGAADAAWKQRDVDAAERAARRAEAGAERAAELVAAQRKATGAEDPHHTTDPALTQAEETLREVDLAARSSRRFAKLTVEADELHDRVNGLKGQAYTKVSRVAVQAVFKGLRLAAEQAAKAKQEGTIQELPEQVQGTAELAARLALELGEGTPRSSNAEDWQGIALAMAAYAVDTPERTHLLLALALTILARDGLALFELEALDQEELDLSERFGFHLLRGIVYRMNGFPLLAGLELEQAAEMSGQLLAGSGEGGAKSLTTEEVEKLGPALLSGVHALLAYYYLDQKDLAKADAQIAQSIRVWPDNPLAIYLTGEQLAASGEWEQAASSLEKSAAGTEGTYMARKIAERAREVRDAKGDTPPLLNDKRFLVEAGLWYVGHAAKESEAAERLKQTMDRAKGFGEHALDQLKGLGGFGGGADEDTTTKEVSAQPEAAAGQ